MTDLLTWLLFLLLRDVLLVLQAMRQALLDMFGLSVQVGGAVAEAIVSRLLVGGLVVLGVLVFVALLVLWIRDAQPAAEADTSRGDSAASPGALRAARS